MLPFLLPFCAHIERKRAKPTENPNRSQTSRREPRRAAEREPPDQLSNRADKTRHERRRQRENVANGNAAERLKDNPPKPSKTIDKKEVPNFRDIPCNKDIYYANALIKVNEFGYREGNILGAIILKWIKENKITFINEKKGIFNKSGR